MGSASGIDVYIGAFQPWMFGPFCALIFVVVLLSHKYHLHQFQDWFMLYLYSVKSTNSVLSACPSYTCQFSHLPFNDHICFIVKIQAS